MSEQLIEPIHIGCQEASLKCFFLAILDEAG